MIEKTLDYQFKNKGLLHAVLLRTSAIAEGIASIIKDQATFSRLKFIGMRVLSLLVSNMLFSTDLFSSEGKLTEIHAKILSHTGLIVEAAKHIALHHALITGQGETLCSVALNNRVLFAHMQALFGAIWLDSERNYLQTKNCFLLAFSFKKTQQVTYRIIDIPQGIAPLSNFLTLQSKLRYTFNEINFLFNACIRQSALEENWVSAKASFQTLEFLGDKVLGCVIADWLLLQFEKAGADVLSPAFDSLVNNAGLLPELAGALQLGDALILGAGEEKIGVRCNTRKLADHMEAVIAALWLDTSEDYQKVYEILINVILRCMPALASLGVEAESEAFPLLPGAKQRKKEVQTVNRRVSYAQIAATPVTLKTLSPAKLKTLFFQEHKGKVNYLGVEKTQQELLPNLGDEDAFPALQ